MVKSIKDRKRLERSRKRAAGMRPKEIWVFPEDWEEIKEFIRKKNEKHNEVLPDKK